MSPADRIRLQHMLDAIEAAIDFARGRQRAHLDEDRMLAFALAPAVQIVGEAASRVSEATRAELPDVPSPVIVGTRNRLVHAYFDIDHDILWTTVQEALPALGTRIRAYLQEQA